MGAGRVRGGKNLGGVDDMASGVVLDEDQLVACRRVKMAAGERFGRVEFGGAIDAEDVAGVSGDNAEIVRDHDDREVRR